MQLPVEQRCEHATAMQALLKSTVKCLNKELPESERKAAILLLWDGKFVRLETAVGSTVDSLLGVPADYEFDSVDLFSLHYLIGLMLHVLRESGVEPHGDYFQMNRSIFKLAMTQERLEFEFLEELEEAEEAEDDDDEELDF